MASSLRWLRSGAVGALLLVAAASGCVHWPSEVNPALEAAARRDGPIAVSDALEALIEAGQDSPADREFAYEIVKGNREDSAPALRLPRMLNRPIRARAVAETLAGRPHRATSPGRWVTRKAMWKPQVKKPACR